MARRNFNTDSELDSYGAAVKPDQRLIHQQRPGVKNQGPGQSIPHGAGAIPDRISGW
jgi:hypothetical protein